MKIQGLNTNYKSHFKSSEKERKEIYVNQLEQKFDRDFSVRSQTQKGLFCGVLLASLVSGMVALGDMAIAGTIKALEGRIKFSEIINPQKSMSKFGKKTVGVIAVFLIAQNLLWGILQDKQKK